MNLHAFAQLSLAPLDMASWSDPFQSLTFTIPGFEYLVFWLFGLTVHLYALLGFNWIIGDLLYWFFARGQVRKLTSKYCKPVGISTPGDSEKEAMDVGIAIFMAAWDESEVIAQTILNNRRILTDPNTHLFVGTYPNDLETQAKIEPFRRKHKNLHMVVCERPGPTSKADCLNNIMRSLSPIEAQVGLRFQLIVLHDAEDVIHPATMATYRKAYRDGYAFIQTPVFAIPRRPGDLLGNTYVDDFVDGHTRLMVLRQWMGAALPSAGVGTAIQRDWLEKEYPWPTPQGPFDQDCITEDYVLGQRCALSGHRQLFVVPSLVSPALVSPDTVATIEFFPANWQAILKQKTRWMYGIVIQGTQLVGWAGNLASRYFLVIDRFTLASGFVNLGSLGVSIAVLGVALGHGVNGGSDVGLFDGFSWARDQVVVAWPWVSWLIPVVLLMAVQRVLQRVALCVPLYGWKIAALAPFRMLLNDFVTAVCAVRVLEMTWKKQFLRRNQPVAWSKTAHEVLVVSTDQTAHSV